MAGSRLQASDLLLAGTAFGIVLGLLLALLWFRASLSEKRIIFLEKTELPDYIPRDLLRHSFAVRALIELLHAKLEGRQETHVSQLARWIYANRASALNTVEYLNSVKLVDVRPTVKKKLVSLTELGERSASWLEETLSPNVLHHLQETYPQDILVRLLAGRKRKRLPSRPPIAQDA